MSAEFGSLNGEVERLTLTVYADGQEMTIDIRDANVFMSVTPVGRSVPRNGPPVAVSDTENAGDLVEVRLSAFGPLSPSQIHSQEAVDVWSGNAPTPALDNTPAGP